MSFVRQGACTQGCGACCRILRLQVPPEYSRNPDIKKWVELHGVKLVELDGGTFVMLTMPCSALTEDGRCSLYGKPERPELCAHWPMTPAALLGVEDVCTYSFVPSELVPVGKQEIGHAQAV